CDAALRALAGDEVRRRELVWADRQRVAVGGDEPLARTIGPHELDRPEQSRTTRLGYTWMGCGELLKPHAHMGAQRRCCFSDLLLDEPLEVGADCGRDNGVAGEGAHGLPAIVGHELGNLAA